MEKQINVKDKRNGRIERMSKELFAIQLLNCDIEPQDFNPASKTQLRSQRNEEQKKNKQYIRISKRKQRIDAAKKK
jgi:hypothetical protein